MPPRINVPAQATGGLLAKLGDRLKRANAALKNDDSVIESGGGELPAGVSGVAQLSAFKFDTYKKGDNIGKYFAYAAGIVQTPETFTDKLRNVNRTKGKRTSITIPMCDTPNSQGRKTLEEHLELLYKHLRGLGVNTSTFPDDIPAGFLEGVAASLVKAHVYFAYEVSELPQSEVDKKAGKKPFLYHAWLGKTEYHGSSDPAAGVKEKAPSMNGHAASEPSLEAPSDPVEPDPDPIDPDMIDRGDITSLLSRANSGEGKDAEDAQNQLVQMAVAAGYDESVVTSEDVKSWEAVVEMINNPVSSQEGGEESAEESSEEAVEEAVSPPPPPPPTPTVTKPTKGKTCKFKPMGADGKTRVKKAIDCEILSVEDKTKTVSLKSLVDGKTYKNVKWEVLNK